MRAAWLPLLMTSALPTSAEVFLLRSPVACDLGRNCFIQQFVDHDPGPDASDFTCNALTYDGHTGTDFALPSLADMRNGVAVLAAAPGRVTALRDGMPDTGLTLQTATDIEGRDCGNGVVIRHAGGWQTQYCHLMQGSVAVRQGQQVAAGERLGLVGLSGNTEFPHLHLTLRHHDRVVDPFAPEGRVTCAAPPLATLWADPVQYVPGGVLNAGFATAVPDYASVRSGAAAIARIAGDAPALVVWGYAFGGRKGDVMRITITGPDATVVTDHAAVLDKDQAQFFRAAGRKAGEQGWPPGRYSAVVTLIRDGEEISRRDAAIGVE